MAEQLIKIPQYGIGNRSHTAVFFVYRDADFANEYVLFRIKEPIYAILSCESWNAGYVYCETGVSAVHGNPSEGRPCFCGSIPDLRRGNDWNWRVQGRNRMDGGQDSGVPGIHLMGHIFDIQRVPHSEFIVLLYDFRAGDQQSGWTAMGFQQYAHDDLYRYRKSPGDFCHSGVLDYEYWRTVCDGEAEPLADAVEFGCANCILYLMQNFMG